MNRLIATGFTLFILFACSSATFGDSVDDYIRAQMRKRNIVGLSLAIIDNGKLVKVKGYGSTDRSGGGPVTANTLFQAGSISKSVAALGALHLVEQGQLALDTDVNSELTSWKIPENELTRQKPVTLRGILSHSAGLTVHGFPGYAVDEPQPTLVQVLDGASPANTPPIRVDILPGSQWRYSGGGYTVMQQMILDVSGRSFPDFMQATVLTPLGMSHSSYEQPVPVGRVGQTACGYYSNGQPVKGRWHIYPEMAAAGLWTTASDLARYAIGVQQALAGTSNPVISQQMARQMLTEQKDGDGLGVFLESKGKTLRFTHNGRDEGFDALLVATAETGQGAAIMINANENSGMANRIAQVIAEAYHWPDYPRRAPVSSHAVPLDRKRLDAISGFYNLPGGGLLSLTAKSGHLEARVAGGLLDSFLPESETAFFSEDLGARLTLNRDATGAISSLTWRQDGHEEQIARIGPLFSANKQRADPDPDVTRKVRGLLDAWRQGGADVAQSASLTAGARKDLGGAVREFAGIDSLVFVAAQDIAAMQIERHGGKVSRVLYYQLTTDGSSQHLLIYLTAEGLVTDYDLVDG